MHPSLKLFLLLASTVVVGLLLSAKRPSGHVSIARQSAAEPQLTASQVEQWGSTTTSEKPKRVRNTGASDQPTGILANAEPPGDRFQGPDRNQQVAHAVQAALKQVKFRNYDIEIVVQNDLIVLAGVVNGSEERAAAGRAAALVSKSMRISNRLLVGPIDPFASNTADDKIASRTTSDATKSFESDLGNILRVGMKPNEAFAALGPADFVRVFGSASGTTYSYRSDHFPGKIVNLKFDHDPANMARLKYWYLIDGP